MNLIDDKKKGNHHWWPKALQRQWVNKDHQIVVNNGYTSIPKNPNNNRTGCRRNIHFLDVGDSPWSHSFEKAFNAVDSQGAEVVSVALDRIRGSLSYRVSRSVLLRWVPFDSETACFPEEFLDNREAHRLARLALSIMVRSPAFVFRKSFLHPKFFPKGSTDLELGKTNIWNHWSELFINENLPQDSISLIFMISPHKFEFVMGDALLGDVVDRAKLVWDVDDYRKRYSGFAILPLAPDVAVLLLFGVEISQSALLLSQEETECLNSAIMISSRSEVFSSYYDTEIFSPQREPNVRRVIFDDDFFLSKWLHGVGSI